MTEATIHLVEISAGVLTAIFMLPQLIKVIREKRADEISILMLIVLLTGLVLWIIYGFERNDIPLIVSNIFALSINLVLLFFRLKYRAKKH